MNALTRAELERKDENWDFSIDYINRLDKGPYYFEERVWLDAETDPDGKEERKRKRVTLWVPYNESEMKAKLLREGFVDYLNKGIVREAPGAFIDAEIKEFLAHVSTTKRVDYAGPVAGRKAGIREF